MDTTAKMPKIAQWEWNLVMLETERQRKGQRETEGDNQIEKDTERKEKGRHEKKSSLIPSPMEWGVYKKPSILAQPGPLVQSGQYVTLQCCSEIAFDSFILHREGVMENPLHLIGQPHDGGFHANFPVGPMTTDHAGTYRCFGSINYSSHEWSTPSDPLHIMITGLYKKPSLLAELSPVVRLGENVTLFCSSESSFDVYHLCREGEA
ncbi:hypothetical protein HPG69_013861, partial [Diceros bicornis minor]